jgi:hypothetical protein
MSKQNPQKAHPNKKKLKKKGGTGSAVSGELKVAEIEYVRVDQEGSAAAVQASFRVEHV